MDLSKLDCKWFIFLYCSSHTIFAVVKLEPAVSRILDARSRG
jgi:hypothetical protein